MDYDGSNYEALTTGADAWAPEYSFDDSEIYYQNFSDSQVYIYDVATTNITQFTNNGTWNDDPHGNHDGTLIAWSSMTGMSTGRHIWASPPSDWTNYDFQIDYSTYIRSPCFSPDGTQVIYDWGAYGGSELAIYTIATDTWANITANGYGEYQADWGFMMPVD